MGLSSREQRAAYMQKLWSQRAVGRSSAVRSAEVGNALGLTASELDDVENVLSARGSIEIVTFEPLVCLSAEGRREMEGERPPDGGVGSVGNITAGVVQIAGSGSVQTAYAGLPASVLEWIGDARTYVTSIDEGGESLRRDALDAIEAVLSAGDDPDPSRWRSALRRAHGVLGAIAVATAGSGSATLLLARAESLLGAT